MKLPKLPVAYNQYGAGISRRDSIYETEASIKFHLQRMKMSRCGAYDEGGAYWGCGNLKLGFMYRAYGEGPEFLNEMFVRARSRKHAKEQVLEKFPKARFYR